MRKKVTKLTILTFEDFEWKTWKLYVALKQRHIINKGKNTKGWWPWWPSLRKPSLLHKRTSCYVIYYNSLERVRTSKRGHNWPWWNHKIFEHRVRTSDLFRSLVVHLRKSLKCNLVDNANLVRNFTLNEWLGP